MGRTIESSNYHSIDAISRWIVSSLLVLGSGSVIALSRDGKTSVPTNHVSVPDISVSFGDLSNRTASPDQYPKSGEYWYVHLPGSEGLASLEVEILEYETVTFVSDGGEKTMPSYCRARDTSTGEVIILDFFVNPEIMLTKKLLE